MTTASEGEMESTEGVRFNVENVRKQMLQFGHQMEDYLNKIEANVEGYRFTVEKRGDGVGLEVEFKALIRPKTRNIPK